MTRITAVDNLLILDGSHRNRDRMKQIPGARFDTTSQRWTAPLSWGVLWAVRGVLGDDIEVDDSVKVWAAREYADRVQPAMEVRDLLDYQWPEAPTWWADLWGFQRSGVRFLAAARWALLADEMGTGKTIQAAATLRLLEELGESMRPVLVVAPNSMKRVWRRELERWWPGVDAVVVEGSAAARKKQFHAPADVYIVNWESLRLHSRLAPYGSVHTRGCEVCTPGNEDPQSKCQRCPRELNEIPFRAVILDEAHRMKDPHSQQTRAAWALGSAPVRFALTGTPIANSPGDLWSILHFISPLEWPSKTRFVDRYCQMSWNQFGGMTITGLRQDTAAEFYRVLDPRFLRRPKTVVLPYLPPIVRQRRSVQMSPKQAKAYGQMATEMIAALDDSTLVVTNALAKAVRLSQFASAYATIDADGQVSLTAPSCKVEALLELVEEAGDEQMVVFAESRQLIALCEAALEKAGVTYGVIAGGVTPEDRDRFIQGFDAGTVQVMLATFGAGGEGLTLLAPIAVFLQRPWSLIASEQAEARVHRPGAERHDQIYIIDVVAEDTIEERRFTVLAEKADRLEEVVRDKETFRRLVLG